MHLQTRGLFTDTTLHVCALCDESAQEQINLGSTAEVNSALRFLSRSKGHAQYENWPRLRLPLNENLLTQFTF